VTLDRRTVLKVLGVGGVVAAGGLAGVRLLGDDADDSPTGTTLAPPEPASSLRAALAAVGSRYLEEQPDQADREALLQALPALDGEVPEDPGRALAVLAEQAQSDHRAGQTVVLDGWVLSRTECRAAALYAL
jgi:hypothetical protein